MLERALEAKLPAGSRSEDAIARCDSRWTWSVASRRRRIKPAGHVRLSAISMYGARPQRGPH
jgi:hypothetical protein